MGDLEKRRQPGGWKDTLVTLKRQTVTSRRRKTADLSARGPTVRESDPDDTTSTRETTPYQQLIKTYDKRIDQRQGDDYMERRRTRCSPPRQTVSFGRGQVWN